MNSDYFWKVFEYLLTVPKGKVVTYGQIATALGNKGLARVVGNILHQNPDKHAFPCFKVVNAKGELTKSFVFGGREEQKRLLEEDGVQVIGYKVDLLKYRFDE